MNDFDNIYVTGDTHGEFYRISRFTSDKYKADKDKTNKNALIILGDVGCTYFTDKRINKFLDQLNNALRGFYAICIRGNHEENPEKLPKYFTKVKKFGNDVLINEKYPNIIYLIDGNFYQINGKTFWVCGGAYSVDKYHRLQIGANWFDDEQISDELMNSCLNFFNADNKKTHIDFILTHTCPLSFEPTEDFLPFVDQSTVDKRMEEFFDSIEKLANYDTWLAGHYHTCRIKNNGKVVLMFKQFFKIAENNSLIVEEN